ncbi:MAG: aspartyl/asparaginyl beta-hydroxylase domain-containing protein [Steroidobacteraceae bacterium]|jgi:aspartyl/asparaginyl beta-hydroxylase (cupin superfamily)
MAVTTGSGTTAAAFAALRRGDPEAARALFEQTIQTGRADETVWFGMSQAHRARGAWAEESAALDQALRSNARFLPALIAKGDAFARSGDRRAAHAFYAAALKLAASSPPPPEWQAELRRIEAASQAFTRDYEAHLLAALEGEGVGGSGTERFAHAIDLLLGRRQIFLQQPKYFYYPELPQIQFYDREAFAWTAILEQAFEPICAEAARLLEEDKRFVPYVQRDRDRPTFDMRGLLDNPSWGAFFLIKDGAPVEENAPLCPRTMAAVSELPLCRIDGRTPSVLFSLLRPGARIPPHHGFTNARLIGHLPLIVPPGCALRVGNETRAWREGEVLLFDDSIEHEAWNRSERSRVVLIFDVWRPELSSVERRLVTRMLTAIDGFGGPRQRWAE